MPAYHDKVVDCHAGSDGFRTRYGCSNTIPRLSESAHFRALTDTYWACMSRLTAESDAGFQTR